MHHADGGVEKLESSRQGGETKSHRVVIASRIGGEVERRHRFGHHEELPSAWSKNGEEEMMQSEGRSTPEQRKSETKGGGEAHQ